MNNKQKMNNQINVDRYGNPIYKKSIKDIIIAFGAIYNKETNKWEIPNDISLLGICPVLYEEDEYGIGCNEEYISQINIDRIEQTCLMWRDKKLDNFQLYAETGLLPGTKFEIQGNDYTLIEIKLNDELKPIAYCTTSDSTNDKDDLIAKLVDFDLEFVLDNMNKYKYDEYNNMFVFI